MQDPTFRLFTDSTELPLSPPFRLVYESDLSLNPSLNCLFIKYFPASAQAVLASSSRLRLLVAGNLLCEGQVRSVIRHAGDTYPTRILFSPVCNPSASALSLSLPANITLKNALSEICDMARPQIPVNLSDIPDMILYRPQSWYGEALEAIQALSRAAKLVPYIDSDTLRFVPVASSAPENPADIILTEEDLTAPEEDLTVPVDFSPSAHDLCLHTRPKSWPLGAIVDLRTDRLSLRGRILGQSLILDSARGRYDSAIFLGAVKEP